MGLPGDMAVRSTSEMIRLSVKHGLGIVIAIVNTAVLVCLLCYVLMTSNAREVRLTGVISNGVANLRESVTSNTAAVNNNTASLQLLNADTRAQFQSILDTADKSVDFQQKQIEIMTVLSERIKRQ